jgi:KDO2-lipid IV(A) lauroyltransferase
MIFPDLPQVAVRRYARRSFDNLLIGVLETLSSSRWTWEDCRALMTNPEELERLRGLVQEAGGAVLVTGHVGNWELLASSYARMGGEIGVIGRRMHQEGFDSFLGAIRSGSGFKVFYSDSSPREILGALRGGLSIGILPDQDVTGIDGIFVDFLGRQAYTPTAPAKMAMTAGRPIYVVALVREGTRFRVVLKGPIDTHSERGREAREASVRRITKAWSQRLGEVICEYPDQWVWMHRRWRNTPERIQHRRRESQVIARSALEAQAAAEDSAKE